MASVASARSHGDLWEELTDVELKRRGRYSRLPTAAVVWPYPMEEGLGGPAWRSVQRIHDPGRREIRYRVPGRTDWSRAHARYRDLVPVDAGHVPKPARRR